MFEIDGGSGWILASSHLQAWQADDPQIDIHVQNWSTERRGHYVTATSVNHTNSGKSKQNNLDLNALSLIKYFKCIYQQPFGSETRKEQADLKQETAARELHVA